MDGCMSRDDERDRSPGAEAGGAEQQKKHHLSITPVLPNLGNAQSLQLCKHPQ